MRSTTSITKTTPTRELGVMSVDWMALVSVLALAVGILAVPHDVPALVVPGSPGAMPAMQAMQQG